MKMKLLYGTLLLLPLLLLSTSCKKSFKNETAQEKLSANAAGTSLETILETDLLKSVRNATSRVHSTSLAIKEGYQPDDFCVYVQGLGGMGYHWVNSSLVDPVFDPLKPEVMLYATGPGGKLRLVAVEYIVINVGQPRPMFGDEPFDVGGTPVPVAHWSQHVWLYENNPSGLFAPFNPNITCP